MDDLEDKKTNKQMTIGLVSCLVDLSCVFVIHSVPIKSKTVKTEINNEEDILK